MYVSDDDTREKGRKGKNYSRLNHVMLETDIYGKLVEHRQLGTKHSNL